MTARGLTLLETLGAVALLAIMGMLSASLLRSARQSLEAPDPSIHITALERLADALLDDPESLQIDPSRLQHTADDAFDVHWRLDHDDPAREPARARILTSDEAEHAWLTLEWRSATVSRWLPPPPKEDR